MISREQLKDNLEPLIKELKDQATARCKHLNDEYTGQADFSPEQMWEWQMAEKLIKIGEGQRYE